MHRLRLSAVTLLAFALRAHELGAVPLRWDEGWSIALAELPVREMVRLTALDVHPPLYYLVLGPWLALGSAHEFWARYASVLAATAAVPLTAAAVRAWWRPAGRRAGSAALLAALYATLAPALVYYAGVTRMYALTTPWLLVCAWGLARVAHARWRPRHAAAAVTGAVAALYTFYYAGFALAGLFLAALLAQPRTWRRLLALGAATSLLYLPWLSYAAPRMLDRVASRTGGGLMSASTLGLLDDGLCGALLCEPLGGPALWVPLAVLAAGSLAARPRLPGRLGVVVLPVLAVLVGAAVGAGAHMLADRYAIVATPFLALGMGWALAGLWARSRWLASAATIAVLAVMAPTLTGSVYQRTVEVTEPYDPATDWRQLAPHSAPGDVVVFNILSLAGAYERYRTVEDPPWTYAQLWDPVHEPLALATQRVGRAAADPENGRLWLVLYKGIASPDSAELKAWADTTYYPATGWWNAETWYQGYIVADPDRAATPRATFVEGATLVDATYTSTVRPGAGIAVSLMWQAQVTPTADARVFVHAYDSDGALVAQHDGFPAADTRPPTTWQPGERIYDRHGLWVPPGTIGPLEIVVGLYDPGTGTRWQLADGGDSISLGRVVVR